MKTLILFALLSQSVMADVFLRTGESSYVYGDNVHCGIERRERNFTCQFTACLQSENMVHISDFACQVHKGYRTYTKSVWAYEGSEAESKVEAMIQSNPDVVDFRFGSINCH